MDCLVQKVVELGRNYGYDLVMDKWEIDDYLNKNQDEKLLLEDNLKILDNLAEKEKNALELEQQGYTIKRYHNAKIISFLRKPFEPIIEFAYFPMRAAIMSSSRLYEIEREGLGMVCGFLSAAASIGLAGTIVGLGVQEVSQIPAAGSIGIGISAYSILSCVSALLKETRRAVLGENCYEVIKKSEDAQKLPQYRAMREERLKKIRPDFEIFLENAGLGYRMRKG